ncbi:hypothetical protein QBC45DRAFT_124695 [Copromyces sp. CBS 386.78]|nr:hypothetical protein QBC45DRAFT_124695 [Copromyces sp. CBS 386.78]
MRGVSLQISSRRKACGSSHGEGQAGCLFHRLERHSACGFYATPTGSSGQNREGERTLTRGFSVRRSHSSKTGHYWEMSATPSTLPTQNTGPRPPPLTLVHLGGCGHSHLSLCRVIWCTRALRCRRCSAIGKSARLELHFLVDWGGGKLKEDDASLTMEIACRRAKLPPRPFGPPGASPAVCRSVAWLAQGTHSDGILSTKHR